MLPDFMATSLCSLPDLKIFLTKGLDEEKGESECPQQLNSFNSSLNIGRASFEN